MDIAIDTDMPVIAAVVLGTERHHLTGWQRHLAIQAMHALGRRTEVMLDALCMTRRWELVKVARAAGVGLDAPDRLDEWSVEFACQGTPMRLGNAERDEVIRRVGYRHSAVELAQLCGHTREAISQAASRLKVGLRQPGADCWWSSYGEAKREQVSA